MRILFATKHTYLPERVGGSESSIHELCLTLRAAGEAVAVLARTRAEPLAGRIRRRAGLPTDSRLGYPVFRRLDPADCGAVVRRFRPDVVVVQTGAPAALARALETHGVPVAIYFRDVQLRKLGGPLRPGDRLYLANSSFTARRFREVFGIDPLVLPPLVLPERYRTDALGDRVLFVTPHRVKGLDVALALAQARPDVRFDIQQSWPLRSDQERELRERVAELRNVCLQPRTLDMRSVYARARLLLVPSLGRRDTWEEGWGRVVTEAQCSGIPVLGSDSGALRDSIGPGGLVVAADAPSAAWQAALSRIWDDPEEHARLSAAARAHAARPEIAPAYVADRLLGVLSKYVEGTVV